MAPFKAPRLKPPDPAAQPRAPPPPLHPDSPPPAPPPPRRAPTSTRAAPAPQEPAPPSPPREKLITSFFNSTSTTSLTRPREGGGAGAGEGDGFELVGKVGGKAERRVLGRVRSEGSLKADIDWVFKKTFRKEHYKGRQFEIMQAAVRGQDILVIAPTGMGKSICFQVPAVADDHGLTLVVSPLLSLMQDQVNALKALSVPAAMLSSRTPQKEQELILRDMESGHPRNRLLYITPERLSSASFKKRLAIIHKQRELNRLVIDEAHCISEWGFDFRPDYQKLGHFRAEYPDVPIMALTASATPRVQRDIVAQLALEEDRLLRAVHAFNRKNLFYEVRYFSESCEGGGTMHRMYDILSFIQKHSKKGDGSMAGIVYCRAKNSCDELARFLAEHGINAAPFHRGLKDSKADENQEMWLRNQQLMREGKPRVDCIVATVAFGMGIDKAACRYVIHYDIPKSFEGFYQETGRAGRDGDTARCVLYYSAEDKARIQHLVGKTMGARQRRAEQLSGPEPSQRTPDSIAALLQFAEGVSLCRHISICRYFGEKVSQADAQEYCGGYCDVCKNPAMTRKRREEGLVELDFPQTQAVLSKKGRKGEGDSEEEVDERGEKDFEPDRTQANQGRARRKKGGDEDSSSEEDERPQPAKRAWEGFRSAAVQHGRNSAQASEANLAEVEEKSEAEQQLATDESSSDEEMELPPPQQDERPASPDSAVVMEEEETAIASEASVEAADAETEAVDLVEGEESEPMEIDPLAEEEVGHAPSPPPAVVEDAPPAAVLELSSSRSSSASPPPAKRRRTLPPADKPLFNPPSPEKQAQESDSDEDVPDLSIKRDKSNAVTATSTLKSATATAALDSTLRLPTPLSPTSNEELEFKLSPSTYSKPIPSSARQATVAALYKRLLLATRHRIVPPNLTPSKEQAIWTALGGGKIPSKERKLVIMRAAVSLESDLFWSCTTEQGYAGWGKRLKEAVERAVERKGEMEGALEGREEEGEVWRAVRREVEVAKRMNRGRKRVAERVLDSE